MDITNIHKSYNHLIPLCRVRRRTTPPSAVGPGEQREHMAVAFLP